MTFDPYADRFRLPDPAFFPLSSASTPSGSSVKSEPSSSPSPLHSFSFSYPLPLTNPDHIPLPVPHHRSVFRFGMTHPADAWPLQHDPPHSSGIPLDLNSLSFPDDYEDADELSDLPSLTTAGPASHATQADRIIRRRSSKACDQCRKCKCKCERTADSDACKSCVMLGTPCTFLGPSRKRGPPKGYIDAIEARLHQTEALLGILLAVEAERAEGSDNAHGKRDPDAPENEGSLGGVLATLRKDTLAREILSRVDSSPYGVRGRKGGTAKVRPHAQAQESSESGIDLHSTHPSTDWQDRVTTLLTSSLGSRPHLTIASSTNVLEDPHPSRPSQTRHVSLNTFRPPDGNQVRRQRRRLDGDEEDSRSRSPRGIVLSRSGSPSSRPSPVHSNTGHASGGGYASGYMGASTESDDEDDVVDAIGQLSLNEDEQFRYHGKASGLYLLNINAKAEARNEGGIWRFPKARVWPPLPNTPTSLSATMGSFSDTPANNMPANPSTGHLLLTSTALDGDLVLSLPDLAMQEHLLELYFTYVHTAFPILHKDAFWEGYRNMQKPPADTPSPSSEQAGNLPTPMQHKRRHVSPLLLLSMFAIAARYSSSSSPPRSTPKSSNPSEEPTPMWTAGDDFLQLAKSLLDSKSASSFPSTVQSLLLFGYREIGIGAMAQAWTYTGMAVRMAQDLGMHRAADGWARVGMGRLFGDRELEERRRIWWGCVILDGYVSTYIGRPLAIFENDHDTQFPGVEESDEQETWAPHPSLPPDTRGQGHLPRAEMTPLPGRILSCFTASATLSMILSRIVQSLYSVRTTSSRQAESIPIEGSLDKLYLDLPEHLRFELHYDSTGNLSMTGNKSIPPPHILTLHMQYWCTTLLLHRPFIRHIHLLNKHQSENVDDAGARAASKKNYELCIGAANHIASIAAFYREKYCLQRSPVFLCFYVFTAGIMHVTGLSAHPNDPQSRMGLNKCMDSLKDMEVVWPAAARANELLRGCDPLNKNASRHVRYGQVVTRQKVQERPKRAAEHAADSEDAYERSQMHVPSSNGGSLAPPQSYAQPWRSTQFTPMSQGAGPGQVGEFSPTPLSMTQSSSYYPWPSEGDSYAPLSTSVLPQMYSTGLIDERRPSHALTPSQHGQPRFSPYSAGSTQDDYGSSGGRYPQFWSDYTSFPQMGLAYGQSPGAPAQAQDEIYLHGEYGNIYGLSTDNLPPSS